MPRTVLDITDTDITNTRINKYMYRIWRLNPILCPLEQVWNNEINQETLKNLREDMNKTAEDINFKPNSTTDTISPFKDIGKDFYNQVITENDLRERLSNIDTPLLISTNDPEPIWELMHDGDNFLGIKYAVGRSLQTDEKPKFSFNQNEEKRCLIIANPTGDLNEASTEAEILLKSLEQKGVICDYLSKREANGFNIRKKMSSFDYDIIHYSGHIEMDSKIKQHVLKLHGGDVIGTKDIERSIGGSQIVFLNGCCSADSCTSMAVAFLDRGAQLVIGTVFKVLEVGARMFAEKFYELALKGVPVGEALRATRDKFMDHEYRYCGTTWASFIMYGDPCLRLNVGKEIERFLYSIGLNLEFFEDSCLNIIEEAIESAQTGGIVNTLNLFNSMLHGEDRRLRDYIQIKSINQSGILDELYKNLQESFLPRNITEVVCSPNVKEILLLSKNIANNKNRDKIAEKDMLLAFIKHGGGFAGNLLKNIGVNIKEIISKDYINQLCSKIVKEQYALGLLKKEKYDSSAWYIIEQSMKIACCSGKDSIETPYLFSAMLEGKEGYLNKSLQKIDIPPDKIKHIFQKIITPQEDILPPELITGDEKIEFGYTKNVKDILQLAKKISESDNRKSITESDLVSAFFQQGGGATGEFLQEKYGKHILANISKICNNMGMTI